MPRMKISGNYYTAAEVKEKLNITQGELYNYVRNGTLKPVVPPGKRQGVYPKSEVDQLAREKFAFAVMQNKTHSVFTKAEKEDVKATVELTRILFGLREDTETTVKRRLKWLEKNPDILYVLKSNGLVTGYSIMLPLKPEKIKAILDGTAYSQEVNAGEIEIFEPGKPLHVYLMGIGVTPGLSHFEKRSFGARLLAGMIKTLIDMGKKGVIIDTLYARSDTPDGINILKQGFTEIPSKTHTRNFIIKVAESGVPILQEYKEALEESKKSGAIVSE